MLARLRCPPLSEPTRTSACSVSPTVSIAASDRVVDLGGGRRRREPEPRRVAERVSQREVGVDDVVLGHVADHAAELPQVGVQVDAVEAHRSRARSGRCRRSPPAASSCRRRWDRRSRRARRRATANDTSSRTRELASTADPHPSGQLVDVDAEAVRAGASPWHASLSVVIGRAEPVGHGSSSGSRPRTAS